MVRLVSTQLLLLAALALCFQMATAQVLTSVKVTKTGVYPAETADDEVDIAAEEAASEAPSFDTIAPSSDATDGATSDTEPEETTTGCDAMEQAFAPSCCPMKDASFADFCNSLFGRSHEVSTGMLEAHEPWIGGFGIADKPDERRKQR